LAENGEPYREEVTMKKLSSFEGEEHDLVVKILSYDDQHLGYSGVFHVKKKMQPIQKNF
jgi:hypothetical protein